VERGLERGVGVAGSGVEFCNGSLTQVEGCEGGFTGPRVYRVVAWRDVFELIEDIGGEDVGV